MYKDIYEICLNMEKMMNMYSKELQEQIQALQDRLAGVTFNT